MSACTKFPSQVQESDSNPATTNKPPVAVIEIEPAQAEFLPGDTVRLNGSKSFDPDTANSGQSLEFLWRALNGGRLFETATPTVYFISDSSGKFSVSLTVSDRKSFSLPAVANLFYVESPQTPVAAIEVHPTDTTQIGVPVTLDASKSSDPNGDSLSYHWQSHDGGELTDASAKSTEFKAFAQGTYVISLRVSDGKHSSSREFQNIAVIDTSHPPVNEPPIAVVSPADTSIEPNTWITLDAGGSKDPENGRLRFRWQKLNGGELESPTGVRTQFRASVPNRYVIALEVSDSLDASTRAYAKVEVKGLPPDTTINLPPIADAGPDRITVLDAPVLLDGRASIDLEGAKLSYVWQGLDGGTIETPKEATTSFIPPTKGRFRISLKVFDGQYWSLSDTVRVIVQNRLPVAIARYDTTIELGQEATLDGSQSSDPDGDRLTYRWESLDGATIDNPSAPVTTFSAAVPGGYDISLVVNDGEVDSRRDFIRIHVVFTNQPPVADAGADTTIILGTEATLDASQSHDPNSDILTYRWTALNGGSVANPTAKKTTFSAPAAGDYVISLVVHDGHAFSEPDYKQVSVIDTTSEPIGDLPIAKAGRDTTYLIGEPVQLDGSKSQDPNDKSLNYHWIGAETNPEKIVLPNSPRPVFLPRLPGVYIFILYVDNGQQFSAPDQVKIEIAAPDITVKQGESIQAAVDAAAPADLIFVERGTYAENILIAGKDSLTILSTDVAGTIVDGGGQGSTFRLINATGVTIRGFTIKGGGTYDPPYDLNVAGITCQYASNIRIRDNHLVKNNGDGVRLYFSQGVIVESNEIIENAVNGIRATASSFEVLENQIADNGRNRIAGAASIAVESRPDTVVDVSSLLVQIRNNAFRNNLDNHIQLANNQIVIVDGNTFQGIGAIETNDNTGVDLTVSNNSFRPTTTAAIFCRAGTGLSVQGNTLEYAGPTNLTKSGLDLIDITGDITENTIQKFSVGINLRTSDAVIEQNTFIENGTAIKVVAGPPCPIIGDNTFINNGEDFNFTGCSPPGK